MVLKTKAPCGIYSSGCLRACIGAVGGIRRVDAQVARFSVVLAARTGSSFFPGSLIALGIMRVAVRLPDQWWFPAIVEIRFYRISYRPSAGVDGQGYCRDRFSPGRFAHWYVDLCLVGRWSDKLVVKRGRSDCLVHFGPLSICGPFPGLIPTTSLLYVGPTRFTPREGGAARAANSL